MRNGTEIVTPCIINEQLFYQRVAVTGMISNISKELKEKKYGKIFTCKKSMLKDNDDLIPTQLINQNILNNVEEGTCYRLNQIMISFFHQEK